MSDHEASRRLDADPDAVYAYLSDVRHLPEYFPQMTAAEQVPGEDAVRTTAVLEPDEAGLPDQDGPREVHGEAWFRTDDDARRVRWGSEGASDYAGDLVVTPDDGGARVEIRLHAPAHHAAEESVDEALERALDAIATAAGPAGDGA
ncbi:SRPBCC family protein [Aquipuribacter sp. SD81]|uniref:SRPBCC family protein n=1 Tax=Aquipuribacter sp. SD81 TaxID=3127703 RepID=UPI00301798B1